MATSSRVLTAGPGQEYSTIAAAVAAASPGDTVQVQAGTYTNDFLSIGKDITIAAVGGMVNLLSTGGATPLVSVTAGNVTLDHVEISGSSGAGISYTGGSLTLSSVYDHGNGTGLLGGSSAGGQITIQNSEFSGNGTPAGGMNILVGAIASLEVASSYIHGAGGTEISSKAAVNVLAADRVIQGTSATGPAVRLAGGGNAIITATSIRNAAGSSTPPVVFGAPGGPAQPTATLLMSQDVIDNRSSAVSAAVLNQTGSQPLLSGNTVYGLSAQQLVAGSTSASFATVVATTEPAISTTPLFMPTPLPAPPAPVLSAAVAGLVNGDIGAGRVVTYTVAASASVYVKGSPVLDLSDGGTATYVSGSGTQKLTFSTTIKAGQNTPNLAVTGVALNGGSISSAAGVAALLTGVAGEPAGTLQVDTIAPTILSLSSNPGSGAVAAGRTVRIAVALSEAVTVTGRPVLQLDDGGTATYVSGSGTSTLTFATTVAAGQTTSDLAVTGASLSDASVADRAGNAVNLAGATGKMTGTLAVDTSTPIILSAADSGQGSSQDLDAGKTVLFTLAGSEALFVSGAPVLSLNDGGTASYVSGSGTAALTFSSVIEAGQTAAQLAITGEVANGGTITNLAGTHVATSSLAQTLAGDVQVDTTAPTILSVSVSPGSGTITEGQSAQLALAMSEDVTVTGTPILSLDDGGTATYISGSGSDALVFSTTVAAGQSTPGLAATGLSLNGGSITDGAGNAADSSGATATPAETLAVAGTTTGTSGTTTTATAAEAPAVPQPSGPGDIVGLVLQNPEATAMTAREITFGQEFQSGQITAGQQLVARIGGTDVPVQMDVKTTYADGSVDMAVLTMDQPALAAGSSADVMLAKSPASSSAASAAPVSLENLTTGGYDVTVGLDIHNADGTTTPYQLNAASLLATALQNGTASSWLDGSQATEVRVDAPASGSLHVAFDIREYADGSTQTDVEFDNDLANTASGGTVTYDATVSQNGQTVIQENDLTQYQYQTWDQEVYSNGAPQVNVVHDINALENTGDIQDYDLTNQPDASLIAQSEQQATDAAYAPLGSAGVQEYMGETGGRPDIGSTTLWNALWLDTQNADVATHALQQAQAAGSVPWHYYDPATGSYLTTDDNPTLWVDDPRAGTGGTATLTQPTEFDSDGNQSSGWAPDTAHVPSLSYDAYLLTGSRYDLDQLDAQASADILETWPGTRDNGQDLIASNVANQVRAAAWSLRDVIEAANATPDTSPLKSYFEQVEDSNLAYLWNEAQTSNEGQAYGYLDAQGTTTATWQQDYLASSIILAAEQGNQTAIELANWQVNFLAGRFLAGNEGFSPYDGSAYYLPVADASGTPYQTWAEIEAATQASGAGGDGTQWPSSVLPDYLQSSYGVLAGLITVTHSAEAIKAFGWLAEHAQAEVGPAAMSDAPGWDIAPILPDGQKLTSANIITSSDTTNTVLQGSNADQLIYAGAGNDTITGGNGTNLLFGGSGNNLIQGGSGMDFLYGGTGSDTIYGGAGQNYMDAGSGAGPTTFLLNPDDAATDTIDQFRVGTDHLHLTGPDGGAAALAAIQTTHTAAGGTAFSLAPDHAVTLLGVNVADVRTLFT